jgi:cytochrome P450
MPWTVFSRLRKARNRLNSFWETLFDHIQTLASGGELHPDSIAAMIIRFSLMEGVTKKDVIGEISILFIAGHETTAHTLSWYIYSLCLHPGIQIANQAAIDVEYDWGSDAESESLTLPALVEATMKESMRRYPVVPQGSIRRVVDKDGYTVKSPGVHIHLPQGTYVQIPIYAVHNSQKNWGPTALTFNPFRWLADLDDEVDKDVFDDDEVKDGDNIFDKRKIMSGSFVGCGPTTDTLAYCPFSFGPRNCLGMNLALLELRKTIPRLLREFNFSFADPRMLDECFAMQTFITLRPTNELLVRLSVRKHCDSGDFITATLSKDSSAGSHTCTPVSTATNSNGLGAFIFREPTKSDKKYL